MVIVICSVLFAVPSSAHPDAARGQARRDINSGSPASDLQSMLARAAEYCDKLNRSVLNFVCRERIEEWFRVSAQPAITPRGMRTIFVGGREAHQYVYDYQLIRDREGVIKETRILLKEDKKDICLPDSPLKTHAFSHSKVVMGPVGILSRESQVDHEYKVVREEKIRGEEALVVEAVPRPGVHFQHLFGTIWLRKKDAGILKIEWNPASIGNYHIVEETGKFLGMTPNLVVTSEYAVEKNGIRFPNRYIVKEVYRRGTSGRRFQVSEIDAVYDQYKFFTVETEVEIRRGGERP
jgi:hypothetical protein